MGLYRRGDTFWYTIMQDGERVQKSTGTSQKKLAERIYAKVLTEMREGRYFESRLALTKTFDEMMERYFLECSNKASTIERKRDACQHLEKVFLGMTLASITPESVVEFKLLRKSEGAADSTVLSEIRLLSNAFNTAIKTWKWCKEIEFWRDDEGANGRTSCH